MTLKVFSRPKRTNAFFVKVTHEFLHASVDHEEMIYHALVSPAVDVAMRTDRLAGVNLQMPQQMQPQFVVHVILQ